MSGKHGTRSLSWLCRRKIKSNIETDKWQNLLAKINNNLVQNIRVNVKLGIKNLSYDLIIKRINMDTNLPVKEDIPSIEYERYMFGDILFQRLNCDMFWYAVYKGEIIARDRCREDLQYRCNNIVKDREQKEIAGDVHRRLINSQKSIDREFVDIVNNHFDELI